MNKRLFSVSSTLILSLGAALSVTACVEPVDVNEEDEMGDVSEDIGEAESAIQNGTAADQWSRARVASLLDCTAIIIGPRHLLTAARCQPIVGDTAFVYTTTNLDSVPVNFSVSRTIDAVTLPAEVHPETGDFNDINGEFADIAIVHLTANIPATSAVATMAFAYPAGGDDWGFKVGCGNHDGQTNGAEVLRSVPDQTYSDNDGSGHFLTENQQTNAQEAGGAVHLLEPRARRALRLGVRVGKS